MPLFLIERNFAEEVLLDNAQVGHVKQINDEIGVQWLYSFLSDDKRKTYCLYEAPSADAIRAAAAETPLAIVLEDIHWADNGTLLALRSLATARPDVAVLWVLTARTGAGGPGVQETLSVLQRADAAVVRVAAMSPGAVADMVCDAVRANAEKP
jgi:hypothetical protein